MTKKIIISIIGVLSILALGLALLPDQIQTAQAQTVLLPKSYTLYATDGYYQLPDGQPLYMYGFIGGEVGKTFNYQKRCIPGKKDKVTGLAFCAQQGNVLNAALPVPTGGPVTPSEQPLAGQAQFPAPIIYSAVGQVVEIRLKNLGVSANLVAPNDPHSIHLHGLDVDAANDGVPETSLGAVPANLCFNGTTSANCAAAGGPAPGAGNVIVYMYTASHPGTYMYHCHQEADIHVQMGMFGALVVYNETDPAFQLGGGPGQGLGGSLYGLSYDKDYVLLLSEFDPRGHAAEEGTYKPMTWDPNPYNWALYKPTYWSINGLSFPQTIHAAFPALPGGVVYSFADWAAAHPGYDPLITGSISTPNASWGTPGEKVLIRVINMGFETQPMHMHGYHGKVIGSDARGWSWANGIPFNDGMEKNTLLIGSGETYDWLVDFGQQAFATATYPVETMTRFNNTLDPVTGLLTNVPCDPAKALNLPMPNTSTNCPAIPDFGDPANIGVVDYLAGPEVTGLLGGAPAFGTSQYFPFHNHDDYKATNNGIYPGGMFTMIVPTP